MSLRKKSTKPHRIDIGTIILSIVALTLFTLVIFFLVRKNNTQQIEKTQTPSIERTRIGSTQNDSNESITEELGTPRIQDNQNELLQTPEIDKDIVKTTVRLFFIKVSNEGEITSRSILRKISPKTPPLNAAIEALLKGPNPGELTNDVLSLIPEKSQLLGARVESGIAFLDFNEEFRFNTLGIEGYRAQVEQIVYTATELSTINKVQLLVEGQRIDYLGGEGFWVGTPLSREDFE